MTAYRLAYYCLNGREVNAQLAKNFAVETVSNLNVDADNFELMLIQAKSNICR